jgi:hypothetical protein
VSPKAPIEAADFEKIAREVDPFIEGQGHLNGLMIRAESFPGWDNFAGLISHLRFVRDHHRVIKKVAAVSDSKFLTVVPQIINHFVRAEVRHFNIDEEQAALDWLKSN